MRKIFRNICISLVVILAIVGTVVTIGVGDNGAKDDGSKDIDSEDTIAYGSNLVKNAGFERPNPDNPSRPLYWSKYRTGWAGQLKYPEPGRVGGSSAGTQYSSKENDKRSDWVQNIYGIDPSQKYRIAGWMKTSSVSEVGGAYIAVDWKNPYGGYIGTSIIARRIGTTGWTFYEGIVKPMPGSSYATIVLGMSDSSGKVWFDDISFRTATCS